MMKAGTLAQVLVLVLALGPVPANVQEEDPGRLLAARNASVLDPALPDLPFEDWLLGVVPVGTTLVYEVCDCGEQTGDLSNDTDGGAPKCLAVQAYMVSRARHVELLFDRDAANYRVGAVSSEELEGTVRVERLAGLERALRKPLRPYPLVCPKDTALKLKEEHAGLYEWCEDGQGRKQGPYRSWFNTGIYLMQVGTYEDGAKTGAWIECNRFERCEKTNYAATDK